MRVFVIAGLICSSFAFSATVEGQLNSNRVRLRNLEAESQDLHDATLNSAEIQSELISRIQAVENELAELRLWRKKTNDYEGLKYRVKKLEESNREYRQVIQRQNEFLTTYVQGQQPQTQVRVQLGPTPAIPPLNQQPTLFFQNDLGKATTNQFDSVRIVNSRLMIWRILPIRND